MVQLLDVFYFLDAWNVSVFIAVSFVLLLIFVWRSSIAYSCTDEMNLRFRSRAGGNQEGEIAPRILLDQSHSCTLSVIIPAFKEATRVPQSLKGTLLAAVDHLQGHERSNTQFSWEIIVVDDGSPDGTSDSVIHWTNHLPRADRIRVIRLPHNMGKGAAVKTGMLRARGQYLLMADADGAAPISEWVKLRAHADQNQVVIGRRQSTQRKFSRLVLSLGFRLLIRLVSTRGLLQQRFSCFQPNSLTLVAFSLTRAQVCGIPFPDTQCGFKLFTRASARVLFSSTRIKSAWVIATRLKLTSVRFAFDVEVLFLAVQAKMKCADQEIQWTEVGGSTISSFTIFQMLKDILLMRCAYAFGFWTFPKGKDNNKND